MAIGITARIIESMTPLDLLFALMNIFFMAIVLIMISSSPKKPVNSLLG